MDTVPHKNCTKCGVSQPLSLFHKRADSRDGHAHWCKACQSGYDRRPERMAKKRAHFHQRYDNDLEWREQFKSRIKGIYRRDGSYRMSTLRRVARWQQENRERTNENARARYTTYYGPIDRARRNNPSYRERKRVFRHRRRLRIAASDEHFTQQEWNELCQQYDYCCAACGSDQDLTVDHIVPLSRFGSNSIDNIQPLCRSCNSRKGVRTIDYRRAQT